MQTQYSAGPAKKVLFTVLGAALAVAALAGCQSADGYSGYDEYGYDSGISSVREGGYDSEYPTESGRGTTFYDGGSITTTDDGGLIYSDSNGNTFSSGS